MTGVAAFFDVDGTICATRSTDSLIWHRARQHPAWRHRLWLASLVWRAPMLWLADKVSRSMADRLVYAQFAGLCEARLRADGDLCCETLLQPSCFADALAEIAMHRAAGHRIVLVSGGTDRVLAPLAQRLGADLLAQRLEVRDGCFNGVYRSYAGLAEGEASASQGARKAAAVRSYIARHCVMPAQSYAYGDSVNDIAMLSEVGRAVAVNPDRRLRREAARRGWPVRIWSSS
jgi:HAD superfamily hydrolase (TIGR01490 family)